MFCLHPAILTISLFSVFLYSVILNGWKAVKFSACMLPVIITVAAGNPLLNHAGITILFYLNNNPVTLESIVFGIIYALAFFSVIIAFSCFNRIMTSDKLMYLFGRLIPILSLMFSMTLRFIPRYKAQLKRITDAQKCIGMDPAHGNIMRRVKSGVRIISILMTWALENAMESADSMKARGFGLKGRTSYSIFTWNKRDKILLSAELLIFGFLFTGLFMGEFESVYIPAIRISGLDGRASVFYLLYALFCLIPVIADSKENIAWNRSKSAD